MRAPSIAVLVLLFAACRPEKLGNGTSEIVLGTDRVVFPMTVVGYSSLSSVEVRNTGRYTRTVTLETAAPFQLRRPTFDLPGGSSVRAEITFHPTAPGSVELALSAASENQTAAATLVGPAQLPPACDEVGPCWTEIYDHAAGGCVQVNNTDGSQCIGGNACFVTSECRAGECVGTPIVCDDQNACTTNACDPVTGCVFFAATALCGASADPCKAPTCDPAIGCTFVDVEDGIYCGPSDCSHAQICLNGGCQKVKVNDGAACGAHSPCQGRGLCFSEVCERPNADELSPAWTAWAPDGGYVLWDSIADRYQNVYWREGGPGGGRLMSVTGTGFARFSVPITILSAQMSLIEDALILKWYGDPMTSARIEARSVNDGSVLWTRTFAKDLGITFNQIRSVARGNPGVMYAGYVGVDAMGVGLSTHIVALNLSDGSIKWDVKLPTEVLDWQSFPVDEPGYLYFGARGTDGKHRYHSLSPLGAKRWVIETPRAGPAAVFGGRLYHWDHWLSETSTGQWVNMTPPTLAQAGYPRLGLGAISFVGTEPAKVPNCQDGGVNDYVDLMLTRVDPATSQVQWKKAISGGAVGGTAITNTVLTSKNTILYSQPATYCGPARHVLREVSAQGDQTFSCQLPGNEAYEGEGLLNDKHWVVKIRDPVSSREGVRAIALPGYALPVHGWATAEGSPGRDNHAR